MRELNSYRFTVLVVLDGDDRGFHGASFSITFQAHTIVKLQGQSGKKDGEIGCAEFKGSCLAQLGATAAKRSDLNGYADCGGLRKKPRQLLRATLFLSR